MQGLRTRRETLLLANAADDAPAALFGNAGELDLDSEGWALIPYEESRHSGRDGRQLANAADTTPKPIVQRFDRAAADAIVADFNSPLMRFKRFVVGLPIFKGHPDAPRFVKRFPDKTPHGTISEMQATDAGLRLRPVLTAEGSDLVTKQGWSAFSPYWRSQFKEIADGCRIYCPDKLVSIGLLPPGRENIAGLSLANATEPDPGDESLLSANEKENITMKEHLIKLLAAFGITVAADATEQQLGTHVTQATGTLAAANAAEIEVTANGAATKVRVPAAVASAFTAVQGEVTALRKDKSTLESEKLNLANTKDGEISTLNTKLSDERKARAKNIVIAALKTGRVKAAELDTETLTLANAADFDAAVTAIEARAPNLHTTSALGRLAAQSNDGKSRTEQVLLLVNARMEEDTAIKSLPVAERYDAAFTAVEKDPKHAALFAAMVNPGAATS